ncbi:MAG: hypothetical protein Q4A74_08910, partial [Cardiobacteriaceae bacterium]|nr:hypothetical protein [Cardiobacteriaceae bacterium]
MAARPLQKAAKPLYITSTSTTQTTSPMSSFFQQTAQGMINRHIDRFLLLKINHIIDWQPIL